MPHLAPFNWLLAPIILMLLIVSMSAHFWWNMKPQFPILTQPLPHAFKWYW